MKSRWLIAFMALGMFCQVGLTQDNNNDNPPPKKGRGGFGGQGGRGGMMMMGGGRMGGGMLFTLLANEDVKKELGITEEQSTFISAVKEKLDEERRTFMEKAREEGTDFQDPKFREFMDKQRVDTEKGITEVITEEKFKRLKQINLQVTGIAMAMLSEETKKALELTEDQTKKISDGSREIFMASMPRPGEGGPPGEEEMEKMMKDIRTKSEELVMGVLTDAQKTKWKEMIGEPIKYEVKMPRMFGRGGNRPRKDA